MKETIMLAVGALVVILGLAWFYRYDIRPIDNKAFVILRHDRWTGTTERCEVNQDCQPYYDAWSRSGELPAPPPRQTDVFDQISPTNQLSERKPKE